MSTMHFSELKTRLCSFLRLQLCPQRLYSKSVQLLKLEKATNRKTVNLTFISLFSFVTLCDIYASYESFTVCNRQNLHSISIGRFSYKAVSFFTTQCTKTPLTPLNQSITLPIPSRLAERDSVRLPNLWPNVIHGPSFVLLTVPSPARANYLYLYSTFKSRRSNDASHSCSVRKSEM